MTVFDKLKVVVLIGVVLIAGSWLIHGPVSKDKPKPRPTLVILPA